MYPIGFSTQCRVRQCLRCQGNTEFYCNTCKRDLCLQCKDRHVIDLDTISHDVVFYVEKYECNPKPKTCVRHPDRICKLYCLLCRLPVCFNCIEHRKHELLIIRTAYKKRQQYGVIIHNTRSETLYKSCFLLAFIKTGIKTFNTEISKRQSEMSTKAQRLKDLSDSHISDVKIRNKSFIHSLQQQETKMKRYLVSLENFEHISDQSANRPVQFLLFIKKSCFPQIKYAPNLIQYTLLLMAEKISTKVVVKLLSKIQIIETGKRQVRNEYLLKLMPAAVLYRSVIVRGVSGVYNISCVTSDLVWISDGENNLILTNANGDILHHLTDTDRYRWGAHSVNINFELIYIDRFGNINKLSKYNRINRTLIENTGPWQARCVHSSHSTRNLLVGLWNTDTKTGKVIRYNETGEHIQTMQHNTGQDLYKSPMYITENCNGDIIVSDYIDHGLGAVVVTERDGRHRFSYTGHPAGSKLSPRGICTDALSHILVCDDNTDTVQIINKNGNFLSTIITQEQSPERPMSLSYDDRTHLLWVGSYDDNRMCVYRYIERQNYRFLFNT